jgi:hypothetical protein
MYLTHLVQEGTDYESMSHNSRVFFPLHDQYSLYSNLWFHMVEAGIHRPSS